MDAEEYKSLILYYGREKFYQLMQNQSILALTKYAGNKCFRMYNGFALVLGNRIQEGIRELGPLQSEKDITMGVLLGLNYAHKRCTVVDKEALLAIDTRMREERKQLSANSAYYAAVFLFMSGKLEKSRDYADKALKINPHLIDAVVLKGWSNLSLQSKVSQSTLDMFDLGLSKGMNIDACLGQVKYHQIHNDFDTAISVLIKLSVRYPDLNIPLIEKMKTQIANWSWDHAMETASRILNLEPTNIEALRIKSLIMFCRDGNTAAGLHTLKLLYDAMAKVEGSNCDLYLHIGAMFARVCGRNADVINCTTMFVEKAAQMSPGNADYIAELGFQAVLLSRFKEATKFFRTASKLDDSSIDALCGLTLCQLAETGPSDQVRQQIEFLNEVQGPNKTPLLLFISAQMKTVSVDAAIALLIQACEIQFKNLKTTPYGTEYLRKFDPDFLLQITHELMQYSPVKSNVGTEAAALSKESIHISLKHSLNILEAICKACPGLVVAVFQLAKVQFMCCEINESAKTLQRILTELDPTYTDAHLLIAQIHLQNSHFDRAAQSLDVCLSHNFKVRDSPMYHLLNGIINKNQQQHMIAIKSFVSALNISDAGSISSKMPSLGMSDKVTLLLEMVDTYVTLNQNAEAAKVMANAIEEFNQTPEEGRLVLANAEMHLQQGKVASAIELLKQIQPGEPYYIQTKTKLADIYLHRQKNRIAFTRCFKELVDDAPGPQSYLMLGNAHMAIQEPDEAIEAFKQAHRLNPNDSFLASKLGRAYVKTHQYTKAINYYKEATRYNENSTLKLDLAELYLKLKQFSNAEEILLGDIEQTSNESEDLNVLQTKTKQLLLLARIRERSGNLLSSLDTLKEARDNQYRLQKRTSLEQNGGTTQEQNTILANICVSMSEHANNLRNFPLAIEHCKEALKYSPDDSAAMTMLARLYTQINNTAECFRICERILQLDANNEAASVMMADMYFRSMEFSNAAYHFSQLLLAQPTYWTALTRLIEVMRRSATLHEAVPFLNKAEQCVSNPSAEAGLNYCKGLYEWYNGNPNGALRFFNYARQDVEWGKQSIFNMIDICLNPDGDLPNELSTNDHLDEFEHVDSRGMALKTAQRLLNELRPKPGGLDNEALNHKLLSCFLVLARRQRATIELTLSDLTNMAARDEYKELVGPIYAIASAHILLKQSQRARNHLKRVANNEWQFEEAEYLERCWLLLADLYIQSGKSDMASDLLAKVLKHNKASCKAYELQGIIAEKNHTYNVAAEKYGFAWRLGGNIKPAIGYKLAYAHMKCKNYANAIDVCQQVMKLHPDYVSIKSDILDKCRNNLRS